MAREIKFPNTSATKKQLWLLHLLTRENTVDWKITAGEASALIKKYSKEKKVRITTSRGKPSTMAILKEARAVGRIAADKKLKELQGAGPWGLAIFQI